MNIPILGKMLVFIYLLVCLLAQEWHQVHKTLCSGEAMESLKEQFYNHINLGRIFLQVSQAILFFGVMVKEPELFLFLKSLLSCSTVQSRSHFLPVLHLPLQALALRKMLKHTDSSKNFYVYLYFSLSKYISILSLF